VNPPDRGVPPHHTDSWHLSKSVPITLIVGLITQGAAIVWTMSMMMGDINNNRMFIDDNRSRLLVIEQVVQSQAISTARMDENLKAIRSILEGIVSRSGQ